MKKILKMGVGALVGASLVVSVSALYQKRKDKNLSKLLALAKQWRVRRLQRKAQS